MKKFFKFSVVGLLFFCMNVATGIYAFGITKQELAKPEHKVLKRGIDVSHWEGDIDWEKVAKSGKVNFAIIRTSYGSDNWDKQTDRQLTNNINGAKNSGIQIGAYHYSYATNPQKAKLEVEFFINRLSRTQWEYPVFMDFENKCQESLTSEEMTEIVLTFMRELEKAGYYPGIYCTPSRLEKLDLNKLKNELKCYAIWIQQWDGSLKCECDLWQYTNIGTVDGIVKDSNDPEGVDLNYAFADFQTYIKENHLNGY